jgi:hypothetical protein
MEESGSMKAFNFILNDNFNGLSFINVPEKIFYDGNEKYP